MRRVLVNVTVPVYNEVVTLEANVCKLIAYLRALERSFHSHQDGGNSPEVHFEVVIADNGSNDGTWEIGQELAGKHQGVGLLRLDQKGRGRALKRAWGESRADILSYMDVDLSTDLAAFPALLRPLMVGESDLAVGSRLLDPSLTKRGIKREFISRCYNRLVKLLFRTQFSDAQCGFKAITQKAARQLLPLVEGNSWFADTELLVIAERCGFRISDLPVRWVDDSDSRVAILQTAFEDIKGLMRLRRRIGSVRVVPSRTFHLMDAVREAQD